MLIGQNLGRRHKGAHVAILRAVPDQRCGDQRLSAAHIALHQAVHYRAGVHVGHRLFNCPALCSRRHEGEGVPEPAEITGAHTEPLLPRTFSAHPT